MLKKIDESIGYLTKIIQQKPVMGIILGTGLGGFAIELKIKNKIPYSEIPHFPVSTVDGHEGNLLVGELSGIHVIAMQGRFHYYEGYSMEEIIYPIRVMKNLGVESLVLSNASGGMNPEFEIGDIMIINDHINLMPNPLIGKHYEEFGPRFPDLSEAYNKDLISMAINIANKENIKIHQGCYVAVTGPTYETPKEYEYFRIIGGDCIGMSTVPEVIAACQMQMKCFAVSVITDLGIPGKIEKITHEEVQQAAMKAEWKIAAILKKMAEKLKS